MVAGMGPSIGPAPAGGFNPWLALACMVFAPFQALIHRGGVLE
jgi:hypothetical protein